MTISRHFIRWAVFSVIVAVFCAGCKNYQWGEVSHPQIDSIAVGGFKNTTDWPALGTSLKSKVSEMVMTDGSLQLLGADHADLLVRGTVVQATFSQLASIKGDDNQLSDYQDTYRGAVYRVKLEIRYEVISPKLGHKVIIPATRIVGEGTYPRTVDMAMGRDAAMRQATVDAARKIVAAVSEAW